MYMMNGSFLAVVYLIALVYLFVGIAIISDIFMEAIEQITSEYKLEEVFDEEQKNKYFVEVPIWNATVANLTLMALGSSAPEILLSVISTLGDIEGIPSPLGPSTIVGSAAFNLLVISGLSIIAVDDGEPKKIADTGVFAITSISSLWAYIWMYICLEESSANVIEIWEAWVTLMMFFILVILSYAANRINTYLTEKTKSNKEKIDEQKKAEISSKKSKLRSIAADQTE